MTEYFAQNEQATLKGTSVIECGQCSSYHAADRECLDAMRDEAHRLLREKSENTIRHRKEIEVLEKALDKTWYMYRAIGGCATKEEWLQEAQGE